MKKLIALVPIFIIAIFSIAFGHKKAQDKPDLVIEDMSKNIQICYKLNPNDKTYHCSIISSKKVVGLLLQQ